MYHHQAAIGGTTKDGLHRSVEFENNGKGEMEE